MLEEKRRTSKSRTKPSNRKNNFRSITIPILRFKIKRMNGQHKILKRDFWTQLS